MADLNGDAWLDLAVANYDENTIGLLKNRGGSGHLTPKWFPPPPVILPLGGKPLHLAASDLNGDGLADIAVADRTGEAVCVLRGAEPAPPPLRITSFSPLTARVDDIVTINGSGFGQNALENFVRIGQTTAEVLSGEPGRITVRVAEGSSTNAIRVTSMGRTAVSRRPLQVTFPTAAMPDSTAIQNPYDAAQLGIPQWFSFNDCDGDGRSEMLSVPNNSPHSDPFWWEAKLFRNTSATRTISFEQVPIPYYAITYTDAPDTIAIWNDVDGDGRDDLLLPRHSSTTVMRNTSRPGAPSFTNGGTLFHGGKDVRSLRMDDFDGDGKFDLLCFSPSPALPLFLRNASVQGSITAESFIAQELPEYIEAPRLVADLDGDGLPDLVVVPTDTSSGPVVYVYRNTSSSGALSFSTPLQLSGNISTPRAADIDGDDLPDLILSGAPGVLVHRNTSHPGSVSFGSPELIPAQGKITVGDVTGDGRPDIIIARDTIAYVCENSSLGGAISFAPPAAFRCDGSIVGTNDMNGDGCSDLQLYRSRDSAIVLIQSLCQPGSIAFAPDVRVPGRFPTSQRFLDVDGDGVIDILGQTASYSGYLRIHRNRIGDRYTLHASSDAHGAIAPSGDVRVLHGGSQTFTLAPNPGFVLDSLFVDGAVVDSSGTYTFTRVTSDHTIEVRFTTASGVTDQDIPGEFQLQQNYPNPFNPSTTIRYGLPQRSHVTLTIFNVLGQQVAQLVNEDKEAGYHEVKFDGKNLASGVYLYRMQARSALRNQRRADFLDSAMGRDSGSGAGDFNKVAKMLIVK